MSDCYAIKDWEKNFENSESRKIKSLTWVPMKNKHDGKGYRRVCQHPKSVQVFCAWNLLVQVASKMPTRGLLRDDDGPLTTSDLSAKTGFPESIFEEAFKLLTDNKIAWLTVVKSGDAGKSPDTKGSAGVEQNGTEGNGMEGTTPPPKHPKEGGPGETTSTGGEEVPPLEEAVAMTQSVGVAPDFVKMVYDRWVHQNGRNGNGILIPWLKHVTHRWLNEKAQWIAGTHTGNRHDKNRSKPNQRNVGMSETAAEKSRETVARLERRAATQT